jgi:hypothetical protein
LTQLANPITATLDTIIAAADAAAADILDVDMVA